MAWVATKGGATPPAEASAAARRGPSGVAPPWVDASVVQHCERLAVTLDKRHHMFDCRADRRSVKARRFAPPARCAALGLDRPASQPGLAYA